MSNSACSQCNHKGSQKHPNGNFINCNFYEISLLERERCVDQSLIGHDNNFQLESLQPVINELKKSGPQPRPTEEDPLHPNEVQKPDFTLLLLIALFLVGLATGYFIHE